MTTEYVAPLIVRRALPCLAFAITMAACAGGHRPNVAAARVVCLSDEGTVRACLVPDAGTNNIKIGDTGCYWFRLDDKEMKKEKDVHFRRKANGRHRQFTFSVTNMCNAEVDVRFDLDRTGSLEFLKGTCEPEGPRGTEPSRAGTAPPDFRQVHEARLATSASASVQCDSLAYRFNGVAPKRSRSFRLVARGYDGKPIYVEGKPVEIEFDPEVVIEKGGHP